ncbi:hypothetical protein JT55_09160 [Rhodovulum sp. NI22]|nr:hypothetical protein JT55_09160 [Rhodovulum sp. NI22]
MTSTLAERYNREVNSLMPHMGNDLQVDPTINTASEIDEIVFRRSEYLGGMAAVLIALIARDD